MQRARPKKAAATSRKPRRKSAPRVKRTLGPMPLVLVDSTRLRQEIKQEYDQVIREVSKARADLDHFHQQDVPQFSRWVNSQFGSMLTEIRETSQKLHENQILLFEIEREVMYNGISHLGAYERIMERRRKQQNGEESKQEEKGQEGEFDFDFDSSDQEFGKGFENPETAKESRHDSIPENALAHLKALYRAVVRKLHPDTQKEMSSQKMEWWHQAQAAYEAGDAAQLEVILSLCEIEEAGNSEKTSLSVLKRIIEQFRSSLTQILHQISHCRRDPAWKFSQRKEFEKLKADLGRKLKQDLRVMQEQLEWIEQRLSAWKDELEQLRRPVRYRRKRAPIGWY
jgi:hypothetical protein